MLYTVNYLHSRKTVHRNLQLDNFVFAESSNQTLKLVDFSYCLEFENDGFSDTAFGLEFYMSPEAFKGAYTTKCDVWSLGIVFF